MNKETERGSVLPLIMLIMGVTAGAMLVLAYVTAGLLHASWAQTAADAAALAGADNGQSAAQQAAAANHGQLISFQVLGTDTIVTARVGDTSKTARARKDGVTYDLGHAG